MSKLVDYYKILGVSFNASSEEIRNSYIRLSRKYHPDVCKDKDATKTMTQINIAYGVLIDQEKRKKYDEEYQKHFNPKRTAEKIRTQTKPKKERSDKSTDWYITLLTCQEEVSYIINMKEIILSLIKDGRINISEIIILREVWYKKAFETLTKLETAKALARFFKIDTSIISKEITKLKKSIANELSIEDIESFGKKYQHTRYQSPKYYN